jgi:hypothetical protein
VKILAIHGIGQTFEGSETLKTEWLPALQSGLLEAEEAKIDPDDFDVVAYGSLFRPSESGKSSAGIPLLTARDIEEGWEMEMLGLWLNAVAELSEQNRQQGGADPLGEDTTIQSAEFVGKGRTPLIVQQALRQLSKSRFFRALGPEKMLIFVLKQVRRFLHESELKQEVLARVDAAVTPETTLIIGHSLGSVVAYEALCRPREWNVKSLITLGSPLGIANLVFDALTPKPIDGQGIWPHVDRWINIADKGDIVALEKQLAPRFGAVEDRLVYNGWKSHSILRYLTARETGEAIAACLKAK